MGTLMGRSLPPSRLERSGECRRRDIGPRDTATTTSAARRSSGHPPTGLCILP